MHVQLRRVMLERGVSFVELERRTGVSRKNLWSLASGKAREVRFATLDAICDALQCTPGELLTRGPSPERTSEVPAAEAPLRHPELTAQEADIVRVLAEGPTRSEIVAERLGLNDTDCDIALVELELKGVVLRKLGGFYHVRS